MLMRHHHCETKRPSGHTWHTHVRIYTHTHSLHKYIVYVKQLQPNCVLHIFRRSATFFQFICAIDQTNSPVVDDICSNHEPQLQLNSFFVILTPHPVSSKVIIIQEACPCLSCKLVFIGNKAASVHHTRISPCKSLRGLLL